jgi:spermidine synthase
VVNSKTDASTEGDLSTQLLISHVPLVLHPAARDVLLVGLGSGITAGGALQHDIRNLDVVEISREVVEASSVFAPYNNRALQDPRLHLVVDDAKTFLRTVPRRYDVIINQPSNPWISGIGALLTEEFFWEARNHLNPGGILVQWIQGYEFSDELFKTVLATLRKAFPYVSGWNSLAGDYFFICRVEPLQLDLRTMTEEIAKPKVGESLRRLGIHHLSTLFSLEMMSSQTLAEASEQAITNTDNFPVLEYDAPRAFFVGRGVRETVALDDRLRPGRWDSLLLKKWIDRKGPLTSLEFEEIVRYQERWGGANPHFLRAVLQEWVSSFPRQKEAWQAMARGSANDPTGEFQARGRAVSLAFDDFDSCRAHTQSLAHRFMSGVSLIRPQDADPVLKSLGRCLSLKDSAPDLIFETQGLVLAKIGRWREAGDLFQEAAHQRLSRSGGKGSSDIAHLHTQAAYAYRMGGFRAQALAAARQALVHSPGDPRGRLELGQAEKMPE